MGLEADLVEFQRTSRTVICLAATSMLPRSKASMVSSRLDTVPFIGESTEKSGSARLLSGPAQVAISWTCVWPWNQATMFLWVCRKASRPR